MKLIKILVTFIVGVFSIFHLYSQSERKCSLMETIYKDVRINNIPTGKIYVLDFSYDMFTTSDGEPLKDSLTKYCKDSNISNYFIEITSKNFNIIRLREKFFYQDSFNCTFPSNMYIVPWETILKLDSINKDKGCRIDKYNNFLKFYTPILTPDYKYGIIFIIIGSHTHNAVVYFYLLKWENNNWNIIWKFLHGSN